MRHIKILGITGGVGAGKSTVLGYLEERYRAAVLQLDRAAHFLMEPGRPCYGAVIKQFGRDILNGDGTICRSRLYQKTFGEKERLRELNAIVHPQVKRYAQDWISEQKKKGEAPFLALEAALLLEDGYDRICDEIWLLSISEEKRRERLISSRGYSDEKIAEILRSQKKEAEFREKCQFVIDNSSDTLEDTYEQIDRGLKEHEFV